MYITQVKDNAKDWWKYLVGAVIIFAGLVFHHKKPRQEPAIEEIKTANSTEINTGFIKLE